MHKNCVSVCASIQKEKMWIFCGISEKKQVLLHEEINKKKLTEKESDLA